MGNEKGGLVIRANMCKPCEDKMAPSQDVAVVMPKSDMQRKMNYPQALTLLKMGCCVARLIWPGGYVQHDVVACQLMTVGCIAVYGGKPTPWNPTYEDQFADDWVIVKGL
jgi:hypothetical protein